MARYLLDLAPIRIGVLASELMDPAAILKSSLQSEAAVGRIAHAGQQSKKSRALELQFAWNYLVPAASLEGVIQAWLQLNQFVFAHSAMTVCDFTMYSLPARRAADPCEPRPQTI